MRKLPVFEPNLLGTESQKIHEALQRTDISGTSPVVGEFEKLFAEFSGMKHAVAVSNGTTALHAALQALDVQPPDEVLIPDFTIISNAVATVLSGARPVFVDVASSDWCLDLDKLEKAITPRTVGVMAVHMYGYSCDLDRLRDIARKHNLWILEDAAQAMGGFWKGQPLGSRGDVSTYSFFANKLITTGEGGAVCCNDDGIAEKLKIIRNLSFNPNPKERFVHVGLSNNYRLSGIQAAMGLAQLEQVGRLKEMRQKIRAMYRDAFADTPGVSFQKPVPGCEPAYWMEALCLNEEVSVSIPDLQDSLSKEGIETRRFFYPLHRQPALATYHDCSRQSYPVSDKLWERGIYLPCSSSLTWDEIKFAVEKLQKYLK